MSLRGSALEVKGVSLLGLDGVGIAEDDDVIGLEVFKLKGVNTGAFSRGISRAVGK